MNYFSLICVVLLSLGWPIAGLSQDTGGNELYEDFPSDVSLSVPVSRFMNEQGQFDVEATRRPGNQSPSDLNNPDPAATLVTSAPTLSEPNFSQASNHPDDIYWSNDISPEIPGVAGVVRATASYDSLLIVAGNFKAAGNTVTNNIAAWDGQSWSSLGDGVNGIVYCMCVFNGKLYVGGSFTVAGSDSVGNIASWNGSEWSDVGGGVNASVYSLVFRGPEPDICP